MGTYLYGLKKLNKPQRVTREDGQTVTVTHGLKYQMKPTFGFSNPRLERMERLTLGRLDRTYGRSWEGVVLFGDSIYRWKGSGVHYSGPVRQGTLWGVAIDATGDIDKDETVRVSKALLPPLVLKADPARNEPERMLKRELRVTERRENMNWVIGSANAYAVRLADGTVEFRVEGKREPVRLPADAEDFVLRHLWDQFCRMTLDWLEENTPRTPVADTTTLH